MDSLSRASVLKDGFDLLMLHQEDYFFGGFACHFSISNHSLFESHHMRWWADDASMKEGSLKVCGLHLYVMSNSEDDPVLRIPFASISNIEDDYQPSRVVFSLKGIRTCTLIPVGTPTPYSTLSFDGEGGEGEGFSFKLAVSVDRAPTLRKLLQELLETAWFPGQGMRKGTRKEGSEKYVRLLHCIHEFENEKKFVVQQENVGSNVILQSRAAQISPLVVQPGWLALTQRTLIFQPYHSNEETRSWDLSCVKSISRRRFKLKDEALEIFLTAGAIEKGQVPSIYFGCFKHGKDRDELEQALRTHSPFVLSENPSVRHWVKAWKAGSISNCEYLTRLNDAAGRSFNDLSHYPVFPWIIADYSSPSLDLTKASTFRDLSCSIAALNPDRVARGREMYQESVKLASPTGNKKSRGDRSRDQKPLQAWMFGSHYSNPGIAVHYLVRSQPRLMLRLFDGHFDVPERMFTSIAGAWDSLRQWDSDVKELIPQFYMPTGSPFGSSNFLTKLGDNETKTDLIPDVILPPWASSPEDFLFQMSRALESDHVSLSLHLWIDLVFGVLSRGSKAASADNLFHFLTYDTIAVQMVDEENDPVMKAAYQLQAEEFGQTPQQLFTKKHPKKAASSRHSERRRRHRPLFWQCLACTALSEGETKED